jgi:glutamyl-tRNA reductase
VPRDIEPEVGELADVYLYTVDDLEEVIRENLKSRQDAAKQAEELIDNQVAHFMNWLRSLDSITAICNYRDNAQRAQREALAKAKRLLANGANPNEALEHLAFQLTNKLLHTPCVQMRQAASEGRVDLLDAARELFNLRTADEK